MAPLPLYGSHFPSPSPDIFSFGALSSPTPSMFSHLDNPGPLHTSTPYPNLRMPTSSSDLDIERLELQDLLRNPHVQALHNQLLASNKLVLETTQTNNMLVQENQDLKARISGSNNMNIGGIHGFQSTFTAGRAGLCAPAERPAHLPVGVLWFQSDCAKDEDVVIGDSNPSRMPMAACIRHENGDMVNSSIFNAVKATGTMLVHEHLLSLTPPKQKRGSKALPPQTKSFFRLHYPQEWNKTVKLYEQEQPLLALCAGSWKAEAMLGSILQGLKQSFQNREKRSLRLEASDPGSITESSDSPSVSTASSRDVFLSMKRSPPTDASSSSPLTSESKKIKIAPPSSSLLGLSGLGLDRPTISARLDPASVENITSDFILVDSSFDGLQDHLKTFYPTLLVAKNIIDTMKMHPDFQRQDPSTKLIEFIRRIEDADPNDPTIDDDNKNAGWGHLQFTSGGLTCNTAITSWADIGNTDVARRLISAALRTCKVARYVCEQKGISAPASFISDIYLERVCESLWSAWTSAAGAPAVVTIPDPSKISVAPAPSATPTISVQPQDPQMGDSVSGQKTSQQDNTAAAVASTTMPGSIPTAGDTSTSTTTQSRGTQGSTDNAEMVLKMFQKEELKAWIAEHGIVVGGSKNKQRSNKELMSIILIDAHCPKPTQADLNAIIAKRTGKKKGKGVAT